MPHLRILCIGKSDAFLMQPRETGPRFVLRFSQLPQLDITASESHVVFVKEPLPPTEAKK